MQQIVQGMRKIIQRAHARGVKITVLPSPLRVTWLTRPRTAPFTLHRRPSRERKAVNQWIRTSGEFDSVFDFDLAIVDPADPDRMADRFDSGDHLHPNDAGYQRMAQEVNFAIFNGRGFCR